jgi:hypothetical protein
VHKLRIVIISSFFEEHIGYQEVQLAKVLQRLGHDVLVVTTDRSNFYPEKRYNGSEFPNVIRIKRLLRVKNTFLPFENLKLSIKQFDPQIALVIHPGSGLPYYYLSTLPKSCKVISFYGDLQVVDKVGKADGIKGNAYIQKYLKDRWYNKTFDRSEIIVANTNETMNILKNISTNSIDEKIVMPGLGFDSKVYFHSNDLRNSTRREMNIADNQIVLLTLTRVYAGKPIVQWLAPVIEQLKKNRDLIYIFAGFMDSEFSRSIKNELKSLNLDGQLKLLDFTSAEFNNSLFNAADYSVWFIPTISIQQSMATGLPAIIPFDETVDHLVEKDLTGIFYKDFSELSHRISELQPWKLKREDVALRNKRFSYESILQQLFVQLSKELR